jgi:hypothetical protein
MRQKAEPRRGLAARIAKNSKKWGRDLALVRFVATNFSRDTKTDLDRLLGGDDKIDGMGTDRMTG